MPTPSPDELVALARAVAQEAAELVRAGADGVQVSATKSSPTDVVTEVDRSTEELIRKRLLTERPRDGFVGEEGSDRASTSGVTWVVDPIDGTVNFLYGIPQYSISIAANFDGDTLAGVVLNVVTEECFTATRGGGAWCGGRRLQVRGPAPVDQQLVITGFSYRREVRAVQAAAVGRLLERVRDVRRLGSAALDLCFVAAGRADAYVEEGLNSWDMAAGALVATEAGARIETPPGAAGWPCVVCAPEHGFPELLEVVRDAGFLAEEREQNSSVPR